MRFHAVCATLFSVVLAQEAKVVNINQGPVRGYKHSELDIFTYYGIPYATAPKGNDRFKAPLPPPTWTAPFEAVDDEVVCPQFNTPLVTAPHTEDCLVANVFVPNTNETNLPVLVNVHGGAFQIGYSNWESFDQFVDYKKNIIVVSFNYRLGPHGFLCLGTEDIPGNAGMKDQVALLRWVRDNIARFGGNPDDVTIHGCSAGGVSVDLLLISKMAKGLFKKAIGMSGSSIGIFSAQVDPTENARNYAKRINYEGADNIQDLEEFYKSVPMERLMAASTIENRDSAVTFSACIERDLGVERFLDDTPINMINSGNHTNYPIMVGYSADEGIFRLPLFQEWLADMNANFAEFLPGDLSFENEQQQQEVVNSIKSLYFNNRSIGPETIRGFVDYKTDVMFVIAILRGLSLQVRAGNNEIYLHVFSFADKNSETIPYIGEVGATHCSQAMMVQDPLPHVNRSSLTPEHLEMTKTLRDLWLNFIMTGNPTPAGQTPASVPNWPPAGADRSPCMNFGSTIELTGPFEKQRQDLWDDIYDRFHRAPVPPYDFPSSSIKLNYNFIFLGLVIMYSIFMNV